MDYLYIDEGAISHEYEAGGTSLLDKYARLAEAKGLKLAITDVVLDELFVRWKKRGPPPRFRKSPSLAALEKWLSANAIALETQERGLLEDFRAGRFADYVRDDRGERSIIEHMLSNPDARKSAIFSDDTKFCNKIVEWAADEKMPNIRTVPSFYVEKGSSTPIPTRW